MDLRRALLACCLLLLAALLAVGCGGDQADDPRDATPNTPDASETTTTETETTETETSADDNSEETALKIEVRATSSGAATASLALACPVDHLTNNDVRAACLLVGDTPDVITTPAETSGCTAVAGQPQRATVTGTIDGKAVDSSFSRTDTCEIDRWNAVEPLFTAAGYEP